MFEAREQMGLTFELIAVAVGRPRATVAWQHACAMKKLQEMARVSERETQSGSSPQVAAAPAVSTRLARPSLPAFLPESGSCAASRAPSDEGTARGDRRAALPCV